MVCTLNLQTLLTDDQDLIDKYDDAPNKIKWSPKTSAHLFYEEATNN